MASYDSYCSSCNVACESTNSCNKCNSCQKCNNAACEETCILIQSFCETSGQDAGNFNFGQCVSSDQLFLSKANWNKIFTFINNAYAKGNKVSGGSSGLPSSDSNDFMTAEMFNKVSSALGGLGSSGPNLHVYPVGSREKPEGDIILGSYFISLESYANSLKYTTSQCDKCNDSCDVTCKECQLCNITNCGGCNDGCQAHSPSYGSTCESCNSCESACEKSAQSTEGEEED